MTRRLSGASSRTFDRGGRSPGGRAADAGPFGEPPRGARSSGLRGPISGRIAGQGVASVFRPALAVALALALALPGCALKDRFRGEGKESFTVVNALGQPVTVSIILEQADGGFRHISENVFFEPGDSKRYEPSMEPGLHYVRITTSTGIGEILPVTIREKGDTDITVSVTRGKAVLTVTETS